MYAYAYNRGLSIMGHGHRFGTVQQRLHKNGTTNSRDVSHGVFLEYVRILIIRRIVLSTYFTVLNVPNDRMTHPWKTGSCS